ncbi:hypothetical protein P8452_31919 [Trifolium repens]|nr:hypothetical protein P8452_31919 [Trifolium repens]
MNIVYHCVMLKDFCQIGSCLLAAYTDASVLDHEWLESLDDIVPQDTFMKSLAKILVLKLLLLICYRFIGKQL